MALDATVGGPGANSYVSVAAADDYFAPGMHLQAAKWAVLGEDTKAAALIGATRWLDAIRYFGLPANPDQALRWPRVGAGFPSQAIPPPITAATCEQALHLAANPSGFSKRQELQAQGVTGFTIGELSEQFGGPRVNTGAAELAICDSAKALLRGLVDRTGRFR